ncbi:MAG TPA: sigma 54-interacting transcriptional regulator [Polyangiaceae bacterium]|nr:sigma 54-interacting transcriptional regulator [Polyangiaceae bacterium]
MSGKKEAESDLDRGLFDAAPTERFEGPPSADVGVHEGWLEAVHQKSRVRVDGETRFIGRAADCAPVLNDAKVSATHLVVQATPEGVRVKDMDSSNGTFLCPDELRIAEIFLRGPFELRCGAEHLRYTPASTEIVRAPQSHVERLGGLVGTTPEMLAVFATVRRFADEPLPFLIRGETGTGKERLARAIHEVSSRWGQPFEAISCAAMPDSLLETELFGSVAGAFTGAVTRDGLFLLADGGTLFLDEVAEMSPAMQAKLLRVLQEGELRPLGGRKIRRVNVRIVSATNADLDAAVEDGRFRQDLFYRIARVPVVIPPLRKRLEDVPVLASDILADLTKKLHLPTDLYLDDANIRALQARDWPGNVRELETVLQRAAVGCQGGLVSIEKGDAIPMHGPSPARRHRPYVAAKREFDLAYYQPLSIEFGRNVSRIAEVAQRERSTVRAALLELGLRRKRE